MNVLELFAGAGGASLGLHRAGWGHLAHVEWDADACATARAAGHEPVINCDVRDLDAIEAGMCPGPVDLLWSSFPCQAWSTAGSRKGAKDNRNGWPWTVDAIDRFRPTWVACENVRGLTMHKRAARCDRGHPSMFASPKPDDCPACYLEHVILAQLRERFAWVDARVLDAADYGVPQHRRRLIILAGPHAVGWPEPTHGPDAMNARPWVSCGEALGLRESRCIGGGSNPRGPNAEHERKHLDLTDRPCTTIAAQTGGGAGNAGPWVVAAGVTGAPRAARTMGRRLTVAECAILQGFPPDYPWHGNKAARYRQVGNAVPPRLAEVIGRAILDTPAPRAVDSGHT